MIMKSIKKRLYKLKNRAYIEAKYLGDYGFGIGQPIKYTIDKTTAQFTIEAVEKESKKHVAKTTQKNGSVVPVIDIKGSDVQEFFMNHNQIEVEIQNGKIVFTVLEAIKSQAINNVISFLDAKTKKDELQLVKTQYAVSVSEFAKAANYEQMTIFDVFNADSSDMDDYNNNRLSTKLKNKAIKMLSLFSGSGTLDKGFLDEGNYDILLANDKFDQRTMKDNHIKTYRQNIGDHIVMKDILELEEHEIPKVDLLVAGIPCVKFSRLNTINNYRDSAEESHPLVEKTLQIIKWSNAKAFLFENVTDFVKTKGGAMLRRIKECLPDFQVVTKIIDSSTLGSAQKRVRSFVLGFKGKEPKIEIPHLSEVRTVKDAFENIDGAPQQDVFFVPTPKMLERMSYVPEGGNITSVPVELRAPNKKFSNYCQRLAWDKHSPTITHVQDDAIFHPDRNLERYISVREASRLFSLPDNFTFTGSRTAIFEMLKNAVDYKVARFLAKTIKNQLLPLL